MGEPTEAALDPFRLGNVVHAELPLPLPQAPASQRREPRAINRGQERELRVPVLGVAGRAPFPGGVVIQNQLLQRGERLVGAPRSDAAEQQAGGPVIIRRAPHTEPTGGAEHERRSVVGEALRVRAEALIEQVDERLLIGVCVLSDKR